MAEYLVYHGNFGASADDPGIVSFKSDGVSVMLRGNKSAVTRWSRIVENSVAVAVTAYSEPDRILWRLAMSNKYCSWSYFTDTDGYDEYYNVYDNVKGTVSKVKIVPQPDSQTAMTLSMSKLKKKRNG